MVSIYYIIDTIYNGSESMDELYVNNVKSNIYCNRRKRKKLNGVK